MNIVTKIVEGCGIGLILITAGALIFELLRWIAEALA